MDTMLLWVLKKWNHSYFRRISRVVRLYFFYLTVAVLIHSETVVFLLLANLVLSLLLCCVFLIIIFVGLIFVLLICCFILFRHELNHDEAIPCLQVRVSDHLNIAVIDLCKGHVLVVVSVMFFDELVNELTWFSVCTILQAEILEVEHFLFLSVSHLKLPFIKHWKQKGFILWI